tara:strand:+ start:605 stop:793 length:189 start_codon:yes stop_codon:yes gene_type:complete
MNFTSKEDLLSLPLQTGDHVQFYGGEAIVEEDLGDMVSIAVMRNGRYVFVQIERTELTLINA